MSACAITMTAQEQAALLPIEPPASLGAGEVRGRTLVSLISPGTEIACNYQGKGGWFPNRPGYAAIFEAEKMGSDVNGIAPGTHLFCMGRHQSTQQHDADAVVPVLGGLAPQEAVLARLMGVTMTTLMTTKARPGDGVLVTGAGPVGYLCAHLFIISGYDVIIADPDPKRRGIAEASGISHVLSSAAGAEGIKSTVALAIDCSGHEQAVLEGAKAVRKGGEVVLVGVPWRRHTDLTAHEILEVVFHNYVLLRSGWEWELPSHTSDFHPHSIFSGYRLALRWLAEHRVPSQGLITLHQPRNAQAIYQALLHGKAQGLFQVFDWREPCCNSIESSGDGMAEGEERPVPLSGPLSHETKEDR